MPSSKLYAALNEQLRYEFQSAYLYLGMAAHFEHEDLAGFASFLRAQVAEERDHAFRFFDFILHAGGRPELAGLEGTRTEYASALEVFQLALGHERKITAQIHKLMDLAIAERDHAAAAFLQWFVTEQVEEEATFGRIVHRLELAGNAPGALLMVDRELGARTAK